MLPKMHLSLAGSTYPTKDFEIEFEMKQLISQNYERKEK